MSPVWATPLTTGNESINRNSTTTEDKRDEGLAAIEISVLALILIVAVLGNSFVLLALLRQRRYHPMSRIYLFMMHLSVADLLVAALNILPQLAWDITYRFRGGDGLCRTVKYVQVMTLYLSTYILMMMAVDRYRAICWGSGLNSSSMRLAKFMIMGAWVLALVSALPQPIIFSLAQSPGGKWDCWAQFSPPWTEKVYVTWFVTSIFIIPLFIISFCYGVICYRIWTYDPDYHTGGEAPRHRKMAIQGRPGVDIPLQPLNPTSARLEKTAQVDKSRSTISKAKIKTAKLTLAVVICFFVCWAPFCITQLVLTYDPPSKDDDVAPVAVVILLLASLNSCTNPWIYLAFSGSLLNQLRLCLGIGAARARVRISIGDEDPENCPAQNGDAGIRTGIKGNECQGCTPTAGTKVNAFPSNKIPSTGSEML